MTRCDERDFILWCCAMSEEGWSMWIYILFSNKPGNVILQQSWIFYPCFCPCVRMSLSSFVLFIVVYLVGSKVSGNFSGLLVQQHTAYSICFRWRCINGVMNTNVLKCMNAAWSYWDILYMYVAGFSLWANIRLFALQKTRKQALKHARVNELHYRRIIIVQRSMLLGHPTRPSIMKTSHSFLYINTIL